MMNLLAQNTAIPLVLPSCILETEREGGYNYFGYLSEKSGFLRSEFCRRRHNTLNVHLEYSF